MAIHETTVMIREPDGIHNTMKMDTVEFDGQFWLVSEWYENPSRGVMRPVRMVSLATIEHMRTMGDYPSITIQDPLPSSLFENPSPEEARKFVIMEEPAIEFPIPPPLN